MIRFNTDNGFEAYDGNEWKVISLGGNLEDSDKDTKIIVEENIDEDKIRFYNSGNKV